MKTYGLYVWLMMVCLSAWPLHAAESVTQTFQQALLEEEGNQNIEAAIKAYQTVIEQMDSQRKLAATAIFRLGECYRKLGRTNEAVLQYQRLIRDFPGEETLSRLSRQNLAGLGNPSTSTANPAIISGSSAESTELTDQTNSITRLEKILKDSPDLLDADGAELRRAIEQIDIAAVRFLIEHRVNVNRINSNGQTPLYCAARSGDLQTLQLLLESGAIMTGNTDGHQNCFFTAKTVKAVGKLWAKIQLPLQTCILRVNLCH